MNLKKCLNDYITCCEIYGEGIVKAENYKVTNKAYKSLIKNLNRLIKDECGKAMLKELLYHNSKYVSSCTAMMLIFEFKEDCERIIVETIKEDDVWASIVELFYNGWKEGRMKPQY